MLLSDFDYHLPEDLIAQEPPASATAPGCWCCTAHEQNSKTATFRDFPSFLQPGRLPGSERFARAPFAPVWIS